MNASRWKELVNKAWEREDWPKCKRLCEDAIRNNTEMTSEELYSVKLKLAFVLLHGGQDTSIESERAIEIYENLLEEVGSSSKKAISLHRYLGYAFHGRKEGNRADNIREAIRHYEIAIKGMEKSGDIETQACISVEIGYALMELVEYGDVDLEKARAYLEDAYEVFAHGEYEEEREQITTAINAIKKHE